MNTAVKEKLDTVERSKLRKLESVVAEGISSFVVVGEALKEIRDTKLYRESHKTFEKYVDDKWSMGRSYANRLIASADVSKVLVPMGTKNERVAEINTERQLRELKDVPAESMEAVVNKAADIAGDDPITASDIKQAREEVLSPSKYDWVDADDEPEPAVAANQDSVFDRASKMRAMVKSHNAAMMRTVDDLHLIVPKKANHDTIHKAFRLIHESIEAWK